MKHINKPFEVNLKLMESNDPHQNKRAITEGINILILIVLGCSGLYLYSSIGAKKSTMRFSNLTKNATYVVKSFD